MKVLKKSPISPIFTIFLWLPRPSLIITKSNSLHNFGSNHINIFHRSRNLQSQHISTVINPKPIRTDLLLNFFPSLPFKRSHGHKSRLIPNYFLSEGGPKRIQDFSFGYSCRRNSEMKILDWIAWLENGKMGFWEWVVRR
jgi:hypothetical protein